MFQRAVPLGALDERLLVGRGGVEVDAAVLLGLGDDGVAHGHQHQEQLDRLRVLRVLGMEAAGYLLGGR